jgi:hypothetical protein
MPITETVATVNSLLRTLLGLALLLGLGMVGWFGYRAVSGAAAADHRAESALLEAQRHLDERNRLLAEREAELARRDERIAEQASRIDALAVEVREREQRIEVLETSMRLLKVDHRLARLTVLDQTRDPASGQLTTRIEFVELDQRGEPLEEPRRFDVRGDVVYVDNWVVKFDDRYVEGADVLRSASLVLFRRIFGEYQEPHEGHVIDRVGERPRAYGQGTVPGDFEARIWEDFWSIANDPARAAGLGIRAAHGEAVSMKVRPGGRYRIMLRASDGLSIQSEEPARGGPTS